jgi:hypothetical protein
VCANCQDQLVVLVEENKALSKVDCTKPS